MVVDHPPDFHTPSLGHLSRTFTIQPVVNLPKSTRSVRVRNYAFTMCKRLRVQNWPSRRLQPVDRAPKSTHTDGMDIAEAKTTFLLSLAETGELRRACLSVDVPVWLLFQWRKKDAQFAEDWATALEAGKTILEAEAYRRAIEGVRKPLFYQGQPIYLHRSVIGEDGEPVKDEQGRELREVVRDANGQPVQAAEVTYSDSILMAMLKAHVPAYQDKTNVELTGAGGGPIETKNLSELEVARRIAYTLHRGALAARATPQNTEDAQIVDDPGGDLI